MSGTLTVTGQAAGSGLDGFTVTDTPATYNSGLYTCSKLQTPTSLLGAAQGWIALRIKWDFAATSLAALGSRRGFGWRQDANNNIELRFNNAAGQGNPVIVFNAGGVANSSPDPGNFAWSIGDVYTVIFAWTAGTLKISVNGAAFVTATNTVGAPAITSALPEIGSNGAGAAPLDSTVLWSMFGTGTLTDANAVTVNGFGNTNPNMGSLPGAPQLSAVMPLESTTYLNLATGAATVPLTDTVTTAGVRTRLGAAVVSLVDTITTAGTRTRLGAAIMSLRFGVAVVGRLNLLPLTPVTPRSLTLTPVSSGSLAVTPVTPRTLTLTPRPLD